MKVLSPFQLNFFVLQWRCIASPTVRLINCPGGQPKGMTRAYITLGAVGFSNLQLIRRYISPSTRIFNNPCVFRTELCKHKGYFSSNSFFFNVHFELAYKVSDSCMDFSYEISFKKSLKSKPYKKRWRLIFPVWHCVTISVSHILHRFYSPA